jgi:cytoskeletal protein CcmA (bactofilin family)
MAKKDSREAYGPVVTTFGKETAFNGRLRFTESVQIDGKFIGQIDATGYLYIEAGAEVEAQQIKASTVVVAGLVRGNIEAADRVEMLPTAKVYGDVKTAKLRIADGVIFEGKCEMIRSKESFNPFAHGAEN